MKKHKKKNAARRKGLLVVVPQPPGTLGLFARLGRRGTTQKVGAGLAVAALGLGYYLARRPGNSSPRHRAARGKKNLPA